MTTDSNYNGRQPSCPFSSQEALRAMGEIKETLAIEFGSLHDKFDRMLSIKNDTEKIAGTLMEMHSDNRELMGFVASQRRTWSYAYMAIVMVGLIVVIVQVLDYHDTNLKARVLGIEAGVTQNASHMRDTDRLRQEQHEDTNDKINELRGK